ncbi:titin homolog isoform X9 [Hippoglossus stenolepis]|uniref:titin homolog isoform X9 n=1 Tax=Hippoglossus stenolepis TaxID=195615 RepID=UPI001FAF7553|nr:titin homolog isoform X9 [Hippoglossus stenolepis]
MHDARLHELPDREQKIHKEPEVCVLQPDTQELLKEHEIKCVVIGTVTGIDKDQASILCEKVLENKDLTSAAAQPKETAVDVPMVEMTEVVKEPDSRITKASFVGEKKVTSRRRKSKEGPESLKPCSAPEVVKGLAGINVVEEGKVSPTKRGSKGPKRLSEVVAKDSAEIVKEPDLQKSLEQTKTVLLIEPRSMSKSSDDTTAVEPGYDSRGSTEEKPKGARKELESEKATSTAEIVMGAPETTSPKISQELSHKEETQTKEKPDSQITEATIVEETKVKPKRRKSREDPVNQKPSSTTSVVARKSKSPKVSQELSPKEETQTMEKPDSQITEATIVEVTKSRKSKEDADSKKPYSTTDVVIGPTDITVVEKGKMSPTKSKPKGPTRLPDVATKDVAEITKEPEIQTGLEHTKTVLLKQTKVIETLTMSKSSDDPTAVKPGSVIVGTTDVEPQEAGKELESEKATSTAEIVMGAPETTSPKFSQELSPKEETQTKEKPDSPITEATIVEETKTIPKRRKSREDPVSQKPSTRDVVTAPAEITVVEKGKMSPTKSKPKGPKPLSEVSTKEVAKITEEPDIQKSLEQAKTVLLIEPRSVSKSSDDTTALEPGYDGRGSTEVKPQEAKKELQSEKATSTAEIVMGAPETTSPKISQELSPKEETQTKEKPDSQITEATIVEETKVKPKRRKSREDPVSQKPSSTTSLVARKSKSPKVSQELSPEETQTMEKPDSQITEATIVEETKSRKSKEDTDSKKPYSTTDVVIGPTDMTVVEKGKMSPTKSKPKGPTRLPDVATKDVAEITKEPEIQIGLEHTKTVLLKQTKVIETLTMSKSSDDPKAVKPGSVIVGTTDVEPEPEKGAVEMTETSHLQETILTATKVVSKSSDDPKAVKPGSVIVGTTDVEPQEAGKEFEIEKATSTAEIVMGAPETTSPKISQELSPKEETQTKEKPDSQITEATIVEETKVKPKRRKSREDPVSQKPSTRDVVTAPTEITVLEMGKMSPTKRRSKSPKPLSEVSTKEVAKITEEPDIQKSLAQTKTVLLIEPRSVSKSSDDTTALEPGYDGRGSTEVKPQEAKKELKIEKATSTAEIVMGAPETTSPKISQKLSPKEETQTMEKPDSQITEATIVEETKIKHKRRKSREDPVSQKPSSTTSVVARKSKSPKVSQELSPKEETQTKEKPDSQITEATIVEETKTIPKRRKSREDPVSQKPSSTTSVVARKSKSPKVSQELSPKEETQTKEKPDSQITEATIVEETKSRKSKEDADSKKPYSTTDVVIGPTDITVVEKGKMSPTKSKPKGPRRLPDVATKDVAEITKEPEIQTGLEHTKTVLLKQTKVIETLTMSKSSDDPTAVKPGSFIVGTTDVEPQEAGKEFEIRKATSTAEIVMGAPETTSPKFSLEPSPKDQKQTKENPESQITEATIVEETKIIPKRRKSREDSVSQKPSTRDVVTAPTEMTVLEKGKMSPTKSKPKGPNPLSEVSTKEVAKITEEPDIQKSLAQTKTPHLQETILTATKVVSKSCDDPTAVKPGSVIVGTTDVEPCESGKELEIEKATSTAEIVMRAPETTSPKTSQELSPKEETQTKENPDSQITEATIVEETKVKPKRRKSREDPVSQKPSTRDVVTAPTEITVVEKGKMSPTKSKPKGPNPLSEVSTKEVAKITEEPDIQKSFEQTKTVLLIEPRSVSKSSDDTTALEPGYDGRGSTEVKPQEAKKEHQSEKATSTAEIVMGAPETTSPKFSQELSPKEETQTKEKPDSQITEATIVEETKTIPKRRKSREDPVSQKPSSTTSVVARKSKSPKVSQELSPKEETQTKEKPDSQITELLLLKKPKSRKSKEDANSKKPYSTTDVVIGPTDITVVEKGKMSSTKSKPKSPKRLPDVATKDVAEIRKEPEIQTGLEHTKTVLLKQTSVIETLTMSKSSDDPTAVKPGSVIVGTTDVEPQEAGKEFEIRKATSTAEIVMGAPETTSPKISQELSHKDETQTKEKPDSQITEATIVEEIKTIPKRRKSREDPVSQKPSTRDVVTAPTEMTVLEKGKMSPTKSKPKGPNPLSEVSTKEVAKITEEPDIQKSLEQTKTVLLIEPRSVSKSSDDTTALEPGYDGRGSTEVKPQEAKKELESEEATSTAEIVMGAPETTSPKISPELSPKEETQTMEKPDSQITEATIVEETKVKPKRRKSREDPVSQKPSTRDVVTAPTEITVLEKGKMSPTKRRSKSPTPLSEVSTKEVAKITKEPDIQKSLAQTKTPHLQETIFSATKVLPKTYAEVVIGALETISRKVSQELSPKEETQTMENPDSQITEATIVEETKTIPKRRMSKEGCDIQKPDSDQPSSAVSELLQPCETEREVIEISRYEEDALKPSQSEIKIETTQDRSTEVKEHGVKEQHPEMSLHGIHDVATNLEEKSVKIEKIPIKHEVCVLQIDIPAGPLESHGEKQHTHDARQRLLELSDREEKIHKEPEVCVLQPDTQEPLKEHETQGDVVDNVTRIDKDQAKDSVVERSIVEMKEADESISVETTKEPRREVVKKSTKVKQLPKCKDKTETDIHSEKAAVKTKAKVQQITTEIQEVSAQSDSFTAAQQLEENKEPAEISSSQQDKVKPSLPSTLEQEPKTVITEKEPSVQFETVKDSKDVTTTDVHPDQSLVKTIRFEEEVSSTESPECGTLPEVKQEIPKILKTTSLKEVKHPSVQEKKVQVLKQEIQEAPKSQETESVNKGEIHMSEQEPKPVSKEKEPRIESSVQFETVKESKDVTTTDVHPDQSLVKTIRFEEEVSSTESPEWEKLPEVKQEIPKILKTTSPKEVKHPGVQEKKVQVLKQEIQEAPKSQETESVNKGEINVSEQEHKTVTTEKEPRIESIVQFETVKDSKDVTTTDVHPDHSTDKMIRFEVEVSSTESPECGTLPEVKDEISKILKTTSLTEVKDPGAEEKKVQVLKQEIQKAPKSQETESVKKGEINVSEREHKTVTTEKESSIQFETLEESKDVSSDPSTVKMIRFGVSTERQQDAAQSDSTKPASAASTAVQPLEEKTESVKLSFPEEDRVKPSQIDTQPEILTTTQQSLKEGKESKDVTTTDVQPDPSTVKTIGFEVEVSSTESPSGLSVDPKVQTHKHTTDPTEKKEEEQEEKRLIQKQQSETIVKAEIQNVPLPKSTAATSGEVWHHGLGLLKEHLRSGEKISPAQKSSTHVSLEEVTREEGLAARENKEEERVVKKQGVESAESSGIGRIFPEMQLLSGTGPSSEITEVKSHDDTPETLITSTTDMDERVNRLVSQILSCRNRPAELSPAAMARQVEEAQQCRESAQAQGSLLSQLRGAESTDRDSLEHLEDEWSAAAQDAAAVIQSKEAQLELVMDYGRQTQTAQTTVERQTAELDAVETSKGQSSSKEAEHLCSFQRSMEDNRTVLGELLLTFTTLCPHLSQSERSNAHTEQRNLHERWRGLERAVERSLHHTRVHSHETSSLQSEISNLREHLETIDKDLEAKSPAVTQWNCKKAQQLMEANAEVKAAKQKFLYLQKRSEALMLSSRWEKETKEIQQGLQMIQDKLSHTEELVSSQTQSSSNPIMEKIITVMRDGLAWAKQTESDIEGRRKTVALLPEEVHRQLRDLKKLQSEVMSKQGQLESLVEEVTELLPQLDQAEEVPVVRTSLQTLQKLSYSTTDKLAKAVREIESGLQTREKMSEQIADLDSWVVAHLHREASRSEDSELRNPTELDRRVRQLQETLAEADKQSAVCEALLMKSKDISSELSISEKCQLFEKLTNLQEDIRAISSYEKVNKKELDEFVQTRESNKKNLVTIEQSLRQMIGDLSRHRYPITSESLQPIEPFKHMILEHKSQVDLLQPSIPQEKTKELHSIISEIHSKLINLETKGREHEKYLGMRQRVEDLRENVREQVRQTKDDSKQLEDKYRRCQTLIVQIPLIKWLCEEARSELQTISTDLYPSQLAAEQQRLKQSDESLDTLQIMLYNNLSIIEWNLLKELDLESVKKDTEAFLSKNQQELGKVTVLEPNETAIDKEYQRILSLKKTVESRIRALEILEQKKGKRRGSKSQERSALKKSVLSECDSKMENLLQARESLRSYTRAVKVAVQFLRDIELCLLPPCGSAGPCSERLEETQEALVSLQQQFQTHVERLQSQFALHPYLSPQKTEQLQENILSQLLVRMSTLQAKGHVQLESLSRCAEHHRSFNKSQEEIFQRVKGAESSLLQFISQKPTCLTDCTDQEAKLRALSEEVQSLLRRLEELNEWCPEQSCRGGREATVTAVWKTVSRLRRCTRELAPRSKQGIAEWSDVTNSVEKASTVLELVEAELPDGSQAKASTEELHDVLQSREQYQDRLDCEHRSLSALELRAARMLGVPAHLEQAPPTPLCQQLQAMQARYSSVKQRSKEGLEASRLELQEREKVWKDLQGVRVWLEAADGLLSEMEKSSSTQELQEVHGQLFTQKALLLRIMESMKTKYSDMYTLVPVEIEGQLQEVNQSLQQVEVKVGEAVQRSGPVHRLGAKLSEIQAGLRSVQKRLEQRSPTVIEAKVTQKRVWDELDVWHSCLAALEVDMQDLDKPEEALSLTERMVEVQQRHSQLAKQAEQRTTLLSKTQTWLQEHREMISSSKSWMSEAQSWLAAPCTYTSAKCLSSHVHTLQMVLGDSAQIRTTLQGFTSVLQEMSQICDVANLHQQLVEADRQVADVQDSFTAPLSQLEHAAAEVEAIESEVKRMESEVAEIKTLLSSPETFPSPREESLKEVEKKIQTMRTTVAEIQRCKPDLCLPEKSEETLTVFTVVDQLQNLLLELEKKVPALFIQQPPTPVQTKAPSAEQTTTRPQLLKSSSEEAEKEDAEEGQIKIVHVEEDVLTRLGATLQTVEQSPPEQRISPQQPEHHGVLQAEEEQKDSEQQREEEGGGGFFWWLWEVFLGGSPEEPEVVESEESEAASGQSPEQTGEETQDVQETSDPTEASSSEALSRPPGTGSTQSLPESMVNTPSTVNVSKAASGPQQRCVVS